MIITGESNIDCRPSQTVKLSDFFGESPITESYSNMQWQYLVWKFSKSNIFNNSQHSNVRFNSQSMPFEVSNPFAGDRLLGAQTFLCCGILQTYCQLVAAGNMHVNMTNIYKYMLMCTHKFICVYIYIIYVYIQYIYIILIYV